MISSSRALLLVLACGVVASGSLGCADDDVPRGDAIDAGTLLDASASLEASAACDVPPETFPPFTGGAHVNGPLDYPDKPPVGGHHNPCWARWGVYDKELASERWVHNLEHGGVVFLFRCDDGCASERAAMASIVNGNPQAILTPYAALPTRFAVVAWGVRITSECFDSARFQRFYDEHVGRGPEQIASNPPDSCS